MWKKKSSRCSSPNRKTFSKSNRISGNRLSRQARFEPLEERRVLSISMAPIADLDILSGTTFNVALDGLDTTCGELTYLVSCNNPNIEFEIPEDNRSLSITVDTADDSIEGTMILELFEGRVPGITNQIATLAEAGFYDGIIFHRVMDNFMIQGGDPTGTGTSGSTLGEIQDEYTLDLQHTSSGILSMAKLGDDTNNSQFFITDTDTRHLDYQHSVFGFLTEGQDILAAISAVDTNASDRPDVDVVMESVEIIDDTQNGVLMLSAPEGYTGTAQITITVVDQYGTEYPQTPFTVDITPDTVDNNPFIGDIPEITTPVDTPITFDVPILDVEDIDAENAVCFSDYELYYTYENPVFFANVNMDYVIDAETNAVTATPSEGITGTHPVIVAMCGSYFDPNDDQWHFDTNNLDYEIIPIQVVPETAPESTIAMTLTREPTIVSETYGEVSELPEDEWIDEWSDFSVEVWAKIDDPGQFGIKQVETDLNFNSDLFTITSIEPGPGFAANSTATINTAAGVIENLGGETKGYLVAPYVVDNEGNAFYSSDPDGLSFWGDDYYTLVARVNFQPNDLALVADGQYAEPVTDFGFDFENSQIRWSETQQTQVTETGLLREELWPVIYDLDDSNSIDINDLLRIIGCYENSVESSTLDDVWASDLNRDGLVDINDIMTWIGSNNITAESELDPFYPKGFPWPASSSATNAAMTAGLNASVVGSYLAQEADSEDDDETQISPIAVLDSLYAQGGPL
jgi:cyclophilin family peptidyl-prolyl cis-trans isomerase